MSLSLRYHKSRRELDNYSLDSTNVSGLSNDSVEGSNINISIALGNAPHEFYAKTKIIA